MEGYQAFVEFCNSTYQDFVPRSAEKQKAFEQSSAAHRRAMHLLLRTQEKTWARLEARFQVEQDRRMAEQFYQHLSRQARRGSREGISPERTLALLRNDVRQFDELSSQVFSAAPARDLLKLDQAADLIGAYHGSPERTYAFLVALPQWLEPEARGVLQSSRGYTEIVRWGATPFIKEFWHRLQQRFRLTRVAIKNEAAQNLARELGETEATLLEEIERLTVRMEELENTLQDHESNSRHRVVCDLVRTLQGRPTPILDQARSLHLRLSAASDAGADLDSDALGMLIVLEELLAALADEGVKPFPADLAATFALRGDELGQYQYLRGAEFASDDDVKQVRCLHAGWRVGDEIITPAVVEETGMQGGAEA